MAHGSQCHAIRMNTTVEIQELKELKTIQEEADTRMLLHAAHASKTWTNIVMSPDTDVFVLALSFCSHINANLYFNTAKGRESQITDLSKLHSHLGQEKCDALVGLHPFSGCDSQATLFKSGRCSERDLPPNQDSLHIHIQRASNLAAVHRRSLECYQDIPPPINHGWKMAVRWTGCHFHQLQRRSLSLFTAPAKKKNCQGKMYMQSV